MRSERRNKILVKRNRSIDIPGPDDKIKILDQPAALPNTVGRDVRSPHCTFPLLAVDAQSQGLNPLHRACVNKQTKAARLLVELGVDVNARSLTDHTPLHFAAASGNRELVELLIQKGADPIAETADGVTALQIATDAGHAAVVEVLRAHEGKKDNFVPPATANTPSQSVLPVVEV